MQPSKGYRVHQLTTPVVLLAGLAGLSPEQMYWGILFDLQLYLGDPVMQAVKDEEFPFATGRSEEFYAGRTPFNVLWPRAARELAFVRAMPPEGPYKGLSPIFSTVGQLQSWSKIIGSNSWRRRYSAAADAAEDVDRDERRRLQRLANALQLWIRRIDPVFRFTTTATGKGLFVPTAAMKREKRRCENRARAAREPVSSCQQTGPYLRRTAIRGMLLRPQKAEFPFSYADLSEVDPYAYADPSLKAQDFSTSRFTGERYGGTITRADAANIRRAYASEFSYAKLLAGLIRQLHVIVQRIPGVAEAFGPQLVQILVLLHRERQGVFEYIAEVAYPDPTK